MDYLFFDLETTGLGYSQSVNNQAVSVSKIGAEIISIGGLFVDSKMKPLSGFCYFCDCLTPESDPQALNVHKLSLQRIRNYLPGVFFDEVAITQLPQIFSDDIAFFGYNIVGADLRIMKQCLVESPKPFKDVSKAASIIPSKGRHAIDVMYLYDKYKHKLSTLAESLTEERAKFVEDTKHMPFYTNSVELLHTANNGNHSAYYDTVNTYLLFMRDHYGKKVFS